MLKGCMVRERLGTPAINETNCLRGIDGFDSFRRKFFAKVIPCFKSFSLNEYDCEFFQVYF